MKTVYWENIITEAFTTELKPTKKNLIKTKNFNIAVVHFGKDQEIPPHPESYAVFFLVLQGSGTFTTKQGNFTLQKGSSIYYEKDEVRGIKSHDNLILLGVQDPH
jgi:quercetin dioxygenase-like cupin family protein